MFSAFKLLAVYYIAIRIMYITSLYKQVRILHVKSIRTKGRASLLYLPEHVPLHQLDSDIFCL